MKESKNIKFPKDFFTRPRPHVTKKENPEDMIPYEWPEEVINGDKKVILYSVNEKGSSK